MTEYGNAPDDRDRIRDGLAASIGGVRRGRAVADQLCRSFVQLLDVDGAAVAILVSPGLVSTPLGTSSSVSHELMELQFMLGEGPCLDSAQTSAPVMVADLDTAEAGRWPTFAGAASRLRVRAVFALPVASGGFPIGALFLHRDRTGPLTGSSLTGAFFAADLAVLPILDVMTVDLDADDDDTGGAWSQLIDLNRPEVHQATGVLIDQLDITPAEALVRLRAHAFAHGKTATDTAYDILERRVRLDDDRTGNQRPEGGLHDSGP